MSLTLHNIFKILIWPMWQNNKAFFVRVFSPVLLLLSLPSKHPLAGEKKKKKTKKHKKRQTGCHVIINVHWTLSLYSPYYKTSGKASFFSSSLQLSFFLFLHKKKKKGLNKQSAMEVPDLDYYLLLQIEVPLPPPVQDLLDRICREQSQTPPNFEVRQKLASVGEDEALRVLGIIAGSKIKKSLSGFVVRLLERSSPPSTPSKRPRLSESPNSGVAVQHFAPPQGDRWDFDFGNLIFSVDLIMTGELCCNSGAIEAVADTLFPESPRGIGEAEMEALGELEFRKQFLMLNYIGR